MGGKNRSDNTNNIVTIGYKGYMNDHKSHTATRATASNNNDQ